MIDLRAAADRARSDPAMRAKLAKYMSAGVYRWRARPDNPGDHDEQSAFVRSKAKLAICLGGNGSGKTEAAAYKTVRHILDRPPPRPQCPFWIIGETYDLVCGVCWGEKLSRMIPQSEIVGYDWYRSTRQWPYAVQLRNGWVLEFKSYDQGRKRLQAASIGGFWFNEQPPMDLIHEVRTRCREYDSPGWADFTPLDGKRNVDWAAAYDNPPDGWEFYRLNTLANVELPAGWAEQWLAGIPSDERETRRTGAFAAFRGAVYKDFSTRTHVVPHFDPPRDWTRFRGLDFGFVNPFAVVWLARDPEGRYYAYDEVYQSGLLARGQADAILAKDAGDSPLWADHQRQEREELHALGIRTRPAVKDLHAGIRRIQELLCQAPGGKPMLTISERCENLIREMRGYRYEMGSDNRSPSELPVDIDNHAVDGMRYGIVSQEAMERGIGKVYSPAPRDDWRKAVKRGAGGGGG